MTLAVGDGANDVAMIREARVGVGLFGKEGRQAVRASDYALAQFRFLKPLILVHGHYCYWRIAHSVQYFFYKNLVMPKGAGGQGDAQGKGAKHAVLSSHRTAPPHPRTQAFMLPLLYFGLFSLFSAKPLYEQWLLTFWNLFFTSLPVLCFGIFEQVRAEAPSQGGRGLWGVAAWLILVICPSGPLARHAGEEPACIQGV